MCNKFGLFKHFIYSLKILLFCTNSLDTISFWEKSEFRNEVVTCNLFDCYLVYVDGLYPGRQSSQAILRAHHDVLLAFFKLLTTFNLVDYRSEDK